MLCIADVEAALDECIREPVDQRVAYLLKAWGHRPEIVEEVQSLLGFLPDPECFDDLPPVVDEDLERVGSMVGGFLLESLIGRGSTGAVYRAEQTSPRRRVAVKLLRREYAGPSALRRFKREGELLGRLSHPAIARIYAMGVEQSHGLSEPYIAMELVEDACAFDVWWTLPFAPLLKDRLLVFAQLCDGVHHAHLRGIVHRDLKPANVLFGRDQTPRLVDFSIARSTEELAREGTLATRVGAIVGTLSYMSPEQVSGAVDKIDGRTDVYALGALLYELLSGTRACDVDKLPIHEAARIICEEGPRPLGARSRAFRGDLETIVEKAMARDPDARYESAAALAADLRRFVLDETILARPPNRFVAIKRFVRKHRVGVAVFAMIVTGIALGYVSSLAANQRTARALYLASLARTELLTELGESVAAAEVLARTPRSEWTWVHRALERTLDGRALALDAFNSAHTRALAIAPELGAAVCSLDSTIQLVNLADLSKFGEVTLRARVTTLELTADARRAYAGCVDGSVWEINTEISDAAHDPILLGVLDSACIASALSPGGLELLVASAESGVEVFDLFRGSHRTMTNTQGGTAQVLRVNEIAWEPNGESALLASAAQGVLRWWPNRNEVVPFIAIQGAVSSVAWSPDGVKIAFAVDMEIYLGDAVRRDAQRIASTRHPVRQVAFSPNGLFIATVGRDARVHILGVDGTERVARYSPDGSQSSVAWVDADTVITAGIGVATWELQEPFPRIVVPSREDGTRGKSAARWLTPHRIRFVDEHGVAMDCSMVMPPRNFRRATKIEQACATALSLDGRRGAIALPTEGIELIEPNGNMTACLSHGRFVHLEFSQNGALLAATHLDGSVWLIDLATCAAQRIWIPAAEEAAVGVVWIGEDQLLTMSAYNNVRLTRAEYVEAAGSAERTGFYGKTRIVQQVGASRYLASEERLVEEVEPDGTVRRRFNGGLGGSLAIAESPNGLLLATGGLDGRIHLFERATQDELASFPTVADAVVTLEWSPDGNALLVTGDEGSLEVIDSKPLRARYAERLIWLE